jgi:hypothetical protein
MEINRLYAAIQLKKNIIENEIVTLRWKIYFSG